MPVQREPGRPPKPAARRRGRVVNVHLSVSEYQQFRRLMEEEGNSASGYARSVLLKAIRERLLVEGSPDPTAGRQAVPAGP